MATEYYVLSSFLKGCEWDVRFQSLDDVVKAARLYDSDRQPLMITRVVEGVRHFYAWGNAV